MAKIKGSLPLRADNSRIWEWYQPYSRQTDLLGLASRHLPHINQRNLNIYNISVWLEVFIESDNWHLLAHLFHGCYEWMRFIEEERKKKSTMTTRQTTKIYELNGNKWVIVLAWLHTPTLLCHFGNAIKWRRINLLIFYTAQKKKSHNIC